MPKDRLNISGSSLRDLRTVSATINILEVVYLSKEKSLCKNKKSCQLRNLNGKVQIVFVRFLKPCVSLTECCELKISKVE
jgi:hypothetical protein